MTLHLVLRAEPAPAQTCLDRLLAGARADCPVHAYVMMGTHVHVLASPRHASDLQALCDALRTRECDASLVYARRYLLACMRYIELNPVRAGIVREPGRYAWSSFRANALGAPDPRVTPHPAYYALGRTPEARREAYRAGFGGTVRIPGSRPAC